MKLIARVLYVKSPNANVFFGMACCFVLWGAAASSVLGQEFRHWTIKNGQRSAIKLKLISQNESSVRLQREDTGKIIELPVLKLSQVDREYLRGAGLQTGGAARNSNVLAVDRTTFDTSVRPVLSQLCGKCHGAEKQEAGLRLDNADLDFGKRSVALRWTEVMDRINSGEMPPEDQAQPTSDQLTTVIDWIAKELRRREAAIQSTGGHVAMRRMNRAEYNNTIRDLIGIDFRPADDFPADPPAFGFDNIGAAQNVSPLQIEKYLAAARRIIDRAIVSGPQPKSIRWRIPMAKEMPRYEVHQGWDGEDLKVHVSVLSHTEIRGDQLVVKPPHGFVQIANIHFRPGDYMIRYRAAADIPERDEVVAFGVEQFTPKEDTNAWSAKYIFPGLREHYRKEMRFQFGPPRVRFRTQATAQLITEMDVDSPVDQPKVYEVRTRLDDTSGGIRLHNIYNIPATYAVHSLGAAGDKLPRPELYVDWIEIEGPVYDTWPPVSHKKIFVQSDHERDTAAYAREVLRKFMARAWRRPVTDDEVERKLELFKSVRPQKPSFEEAIKTPLVAVLTSPHFLYLTEDSSLMPGSEHAGRAANNSESQETLDDYEIASRLSYFLWSSMPDESLLQLAGQQRLGDASTLQQQVDRMLADSKSIAFTQNFAGQWLDLREVGVNPPSGNYFRRYDEHLRVSMVRESEGFFAEILHNDLPVTNFIKSDFVTINERLARFYNIENVRGDHIRRVAVPPGVHRGGVLTQASMLTVTSNGTRTSPVARGKWILDNILGDPPPPPPPDAGEIPQKVPGMGKVTVRRRLELHRQLPACAACHNKIDPLGFALENFRGDGSWAVQEAHGWHGWTNQDDPPINASARMPNGQEINGIEDLQNELLKQEDKFLFCLVEKLATYALGRGMEYSDREWLNSLTSNMKSNGKTLRGVIKDIVASEQFRTK